MGDLPRRVPTGQDSEGLGHWVRPHSRPKGTLPACSAASFPSGDKSHQGPQVPRGLSEMNRAWETGTKGRQSRTCHSFPFPRRRRRKYILRHKEPLDLSLDTAGGSEPPLKPG